jgi:hypothetical protein
MNLYRVLRALVIGQIVTILLVSFNHVSSLLVVFAAGLVFSMAAYMAFVAWQREHGQGKGT